MSTISLYVGGTTGYPARAGLQGVGVFEQVIDFAAVLAAKGSALAAEDIVQAISLPAGVQIISAGAEVLTAANPSAATINVGLAGGDTIVDGADAKTAGYCAVGTNGFLQTAGNRLSAADTIDVTLATLTGTISTGKVRVYVVIANIS